MIALTLVIIGALNWLLIGVFNWNLVSALFGNIQWLERLIYILVGLSGVMMLVRCPCKQCKNGACDASDCLPETEAAMEEEIEALEEEIEELEKEEDEKIEKEITS